MNKISQWQNTREIKIFPKTNIYLLFVTFFIISFFTLVFFIPSSVHAAPLEGDGSGLSGWWKFDEGTSSSTVDSSGNGNTGSLAGGTSWTTGIVGGALQCDGSSGYMQATATSGISYSNPVTVSLLVKRTSGTDLKEFFNLADSSSKQVMTLMFGSAWNGLLVSRVDNVTASKSMQPSTAIVQSDWNHIVVTDPGGDATTTIYINGALNSANQGGGGASKWGTSVVQVCKGITDAYNTAAIVDDVRIYNRVLSPTEVAALNTEYDAAPIITAFTLPSFGATTVSVSAFTATDTFGVTGYLINETSSTPSVSDPNWSTSTPTTFTFVGTGTRTAYAWAKNSAGNISASASATVIIDTTPPTITAFSLSSATYVASTTVGISAFTATDTGGSGVTGYLINEISSTPSASASGWSAIPPTTYTFSGMVGAKTLYAWAKDATGNVSASTNASVTITAGYPVYQANSGLVRVGPLYNATSSGATASTRTNVWTTNFITIGHNFRIREAGSLARVKFYFKTTTGLDGFYITVWRKNGTNYDRVGISENIFPSMTANSMNDITFTSPITGVQEGDYLGYDTHASANPAGGVAFAAWPSYTAGYVTTYYTDSLASFTNVNISSWSASTDYAFPIEMYMTPPVFVGLGDSIMAGGATHQSYVRPGGTLNNPTSTIEYQLGALTGYSYQNMGAGSQTTTNMANRFTSDTVDDSVVPLKPRMVVINGGVNDIGGGSITKTTFLANWTSMLNAAQADSDITVVIVLKILPWTNGTNAQMQTRDDWNNSLATLAASYSKAIVVDAGSYIGQFRSGGDAGNLWDIQSIYNTDGVHPNSVGMGQIAQAIADALDSAPPVVTAFATPLFASSTTVSITSFTATDNVGVTSYLVNQSSSLPSASDAGWLSSKPLSSTCSSEGTNILYGWAMDATGHTSASASSSVFIDTIAPSSVGASTFGTITTSSIEIIKPATATENGSGLYQWQARRNESTELGFNTTSTNTVTDSNLSPNTQYTYDVKFKDNVNNVSSYGTQTSKYTLANIPNNLTFTINSDSPSSETTADWQANSNPAGTNYYIENTTAGTNSGWTTSFSWISTGLHCSKTYSFRIKAKNGDGTETSWSETTGRTRACGGGGISPTITSPIINPVVSPVTPSVAALQDQLNGLLATLHSLQAQQAAQQGSSASSYLSVAFNKDFRLGDVDSDIKALQQYLNASGFTLAKQGPGSSGNETNRFGALTRVALIKFQEAHAEEILAPVGLVKGTGFFGSSTRNYINSLK